MSKLTILLAVLEGFRCQIILDELETLSEDSLTKIFEKSVIEINKRKKQKAEK